MGAQGSDAAMVPWWRSFAFRFVLLYTVFAVILALVSVAGLYQREKAEVIGKFGLALEKIAGTAAPFIPGEPLDEISSNQDASTQPFLRLRDTLRDIQTENNLHEEHVYILRPSPDPDTQELEFVVMLHGTPFVGDHYMPPPEVGTLYRWVIHKKDAVRTGLYRDAHGMWISGIAPILRADGSIAGLLQVDYGLDTYLSEIDARQGKYLLVVLLMFAVFILGGLWMNARLRRSLSALLDGTQAIEKHCYDHTILVRSQDEIGLLASALNRALGGLRERFEMLKFLPAHTTRMIETAARKGHAVDRSIAERCEVAVFESDIRGFTSLSEALPAEAVVRMLNDYIRVQAEIINQHGGSIDKYMGDAVLAIFEGEDKERRAFDCALEIQSQIARLNESGTFERPVLIGIGVTVGELVMGNMGSDERMELTIIGSPVNLAARLCSQARGRRDRDVPADPRRSGSLPDAGGEDRPRRENVQVKGFDGPVACYRARLV